MNHDEMISKAIENAKESHPLEASHGIVLCKMIAELARLITSVATNDDDISDALTLIEDVRALRERIVS